MLHFYYVTNCVKLIIIIKGGKVHVKKHLIALPMKQITVVEETRDPLMLMLCEGLCQRPDMEESQWIVSYCTMRCIWMMGNAAPPTNKVC